jgi:hypothetical protein
MIEYLFILIITICVVILIGIYIFRKKYGLTTNLHKVKKGSTDILPESVYVVDKIKNISKAKPNIKMTIDYKRDVSDHKIQPINENKVASWFKSDIYVDSRIVSIPLNIHFLLDIDYKINGQNYNTYVNLTNINVIINRLNDIYKPLHVEFYLQETIKENTSVNCGKYFWNRGNISNENIETHLNMILDFFKSDENQSYFNCMTNNHYRTIAKFLLYTLINTREIKDGINLYILPFLWRDMVSVISDVNKPIIFIPEYNYNYDNKVTPIFLTIIDSIANQLAENISLLFGMNNEEFKNMKDISLHRFQYLRYIMKNKAYIDLNTIRSDKVLEIEDNASQYSDYFKIDKKDRFNLLYNKDAFLKKRIENNLELIDNYIQNYLETNYLRQEVKEEELSEECKPSKTYYDTLNYPFY